MDEELNKAIKGVGFRRTDMEPKGPIKIILCLYSIYSLVPYYEPKIPNPKPLISQLGSEISVR